jgi:AcrR family transcriptional regulator
VETLRDRKRARTRAALVDAATALFLRDGYLETTIADIAEAADVGTRTFFSYFSSKDELLFPDADTRVEAALAAIAGRGPDEHPQDVLVRALGEIGVTGTDLVEERAALRLQLIDTVPAVAGRALQVQADAEAAIASALHDAYPGELDAITAAAMVGAFIGAVAAVLRVVFADPEWSSFGQAERERRVRSATAAALRPWFPEAGAGR